MVVEMFRFVSIRAPQADGSSDEGGLAFAIDGGTRFVGTVRENREPAARSKLLAIVRGYVASPDFIGSLDQADARLVSFSGSLRSLPADGFAAALPEAFKAAFGTDARSIGGDQKLDSARRRIGDSIVAACIDTSLVARTRSALIEAATACEVIAALADGRTVRRADLERAMVVLPQGVFPLPRKTLGAGDRAKRSAAKAAERASRHTAVERSVDEIDATRGAIDELVTVFRRRTVAPAVARAGRTRPQPNEAIDSFSLSANERSALTPHTRNALRAIGVGDAVDVSRAIPLLEARLFTVARSLHAARAARMVRIGNTIMPSDYVLNGPAGPGSATRHAGECPPAELDAAGEETGAITVPSGHGDARVLGIADLMLVEQKLARYELGEIAHIENVMRGEKRERKFRTASTLEETAFTESEETEASEKDLSTTERFELQSQSQQVIAETANKQAGLTISASYGPAVNATATLSAGGTSSRQQSSSVASSYARETTSRAVARLQKRKLERRSTRTVREVEENNLHGFENADGEDISGIYRFVDKIYTAQVVNYGKRLMLEFMLPEPAAFYRHALSRQPLDPVGHTCPEVPGYCLGDGLTFVPLQAADIEPDNYISWASKYGAEDVQAPLSTTRIVSVAKRGPDAFGTTGTGAESPPKISSEAWEMDIPDGYVPSTATINVYGETQDGTPHKLMIQIQDQQLEYSEPWQDHVTLTLRPDVTAKVPISVNSIRFYNYEVLFSVLCILRLEKMDDWRLKTFFSIMKAYETARSRYYAAIEAARLSAAYAAPNWRSPAANREIEATELKRACITLMSGQHFETFDAMARNVAPHGYPEIDLPEANAEARYVQLFEQGIDWINLTYLFYPYYWSRKDQWLTLVQLSDEDALFARFLQAGSARVQVPVRQGFETTILNYLAGVEIWNAEGNLINFDDVGPGSPHLSMIDELKSQLGNSYEEGPGTVAVTKNSAEVTGDGEQVWGDEHMRRRIRFGVETYVIVNTAGGGFTLDRPYEGDTDAGTTYALGPQLIGEPWEILIPTSLVKLDDYAFV